MLDHNKHDNSEKLLRIKDVREMTGLSTSTIYLQIRKGEFPRPLQASAQSVAWRKSDIQKWIGGLKHAIR